MPGATAFQVPPFPPRAGGSLGFASSGRGDSFLRSSHRARSDRRQSIESQDQAEAQKTSPPGAHPTPPLTPPHAGGPVGFASAVQNIFSWRGGGGKRSHGPRRGGKGKPYGRGGSAPVPHAAPLPSSLAAQKQKTPPPLRPKKMWEGRKARPLADEDYIIGRLFHVYHSETLQIARQRLII